MKKIAFLLIISPFLSLSQIPDGTYKMAKITITGGIMSDIDSSAEVDPTVDIDIKSITNVDLNHWNFAYGLIYDYPSFSNLNYLINHVWIPQTTDDLAEGSTNLYYSTSKFNSAFNSKTTDNLSEGISNKYFSNSLARNAISGSGLIGYNSLTGVFSIPQSSSIQSGTLSSSDWSVFNNKQNSLVSGTNIKTVGGTSILGSGDIPFPSTVGTNNASAYSSGSVYTLTTTSSKVTFGTTSPSITIPAAGTYLIFSNIKLQYTGLTTLVTQTCSFKVRRTNNTASDITNAITTFNVPVVTLLTSTAGDCDIAPIIYTTTNNNDVLEIWGNSGASVSVGSIQVGEASLVAIRIY